MNVVLFLAIVALPVELFVFNRLSGSGEQSVGG